jgi:hypothetical protein
MGASPRRIFVAGSGDKRVRKWCRQARSPECVEAKFSEGW